MVCEWEEDSFSFLVMVIDCSIWILLDSGPLPFRKGMSK